MKEQAELKDKPRSAGTIWICAIAALAMAYGWGYRGIVGHEGGAMAPGAMVGLAVCLGAARADWHRRAAVAGLFGAVGWAWGGSLSYMEQTFYTTSYSFPDVFYGYAMLFLFGALWAGIGGATLGLAFTLPRSRLERFVGPFTAICTVFLIVYLYWQFNPSQWLMFEDFTAIHFHDGDWFPATLVIGVSGVYALVRRKERHEALLFLFCALGWWIGYLAFTKFGGISLGPPFRSESWGGVVGILAVFIFYLVHQKNRAALMLCMYGVVGGGLAFSLAVFIRHPIFVAWGPFEAFQGRTQWKIAEESFGLLMGLAIALGVARLARGGLAPADEDVPRKPLDVFSVFVILVAILWVNLRRTPMRCMRNWEIPADVPIAGFLPWTWYIAGGVLLTAIALCMLALYAKDRLVLTPPTAYGKGLAVLLLLIWLTVAGSIAQFLSEPLEGLLLVGGHFFLLAGGATLLALIRGGQVGTNPVEPRSKVPSDDLRWRLGWRHGLVWLCVPVVLLVITNLSMAMQDGPKPGTRLRFGPEAYWREATHIVGTWEVQGFAKTLNKEPDTKADVGFDAITFGWNRGVNVVYKDGRSGPLDHRWHHADSRVWLDWYGRVFDSTERASVAITFHEGRVYIPWPPNGEQQRFLVLDKRQDPS